MPMLMLISAYVSPYSSLRYAAAAADEARLPLFFAS